MPVNDADFMAYIQGLGIAYREQGDEVVFAYCPFCEPNTKATYEHFYFNRTKQIFCCHKCQERGNLYYFKVQRGDLAVPTRVGRQQTRRPNRNEQHFGHLEKFCQYYTRQRGISGAVVKQYGIGWMKHGDKVVIIYHFFDQNGILLNRKYRAPDKKQWQDKNTERGYYGLQFVDFTKRELHVCEGEDDCHALAQMGFDNVVSVPSGAGTYTPAMDKINARFSRVVLLFDSDDAGQAGAKAFAKKAGLHKCWNVVLRYKDARDCLLNHMDIFGIQALVRSASRFRDETIVRVGDVARYAAEQILDPRRAVGRMLRIAQFNRVVGGMRTGEMSVLTGHTGHGKSTVAYNLATWAEEVGLPVLIMSFENTMSVVIRKLIEIRSRMEVYTFNEATNRKQLAVTEEWLRAQIEMLDKRKFFLLDTRERKDSGYLSVNDVCGAIRYAAKFYNVKLVVVDHLHYFLKISDAKNPVLKIDETIRALKTLSIETDTHILLIVHPHKTVDSRTGKLSKLGLNSSKGASSIAQEADNYWIVSKGLLEEQPKSLLDVEKNRAFGATGPIMFDVLSNLNTLIPEEKLEVAEGKAGETPWYVD